MPVLRLCFLGPPQITRDGEPVELAAAKANALLAYLAVHGKRQTRDRLADLLWPESLPDAGRKNLRNTLWRIGKTLGEGVDADADRVALADDVWVDVRAFETAVRAPSQDFAPAPDTLRDAIDLYRGPLLEGLTLNEAPEFEIWLTTERERLGQLYLRALSALAAHERAQDDWRAVITLAQQSLAYDNLQEPMWRLLMEAHARLGERAEALRQYELLRDVLARELDVEPMSDTQALHDAILDGTLIGSRPLAPATTAPRRRRVATPRPSTPFVGRLAERATLDEALRAATSGQERVVLLTGELGIGKSRLWQVWSNALPPEVVKLETRCLDTTRSLPYAPLIGLFRQEACAERLLKPPSVVPEAWLAELARLLPEIRAHWPELPNPVRLPPEEERHRLFEAFVQVLRAVEAQPLILFIDDLHWADHATLDWLVYLIDRMRDEPVLLAGAYRPSDAPSQLSSLAAQWSREGLGQPLPLPRLSPEEAGELIAALGGDPALADELHANSAGNPYFLIELSQAPTGGPPPRLAELIRTRLGRLPDAARQVIQAAAILDADFALDTLRTTSGRDEEETLDALDTLLEAEVVVERGDRLAFAHPLVAMVVRGDLSIARRSFLHRRAAEALETKHAGSLPSVAGRLANHFAQAGRPARAARYAALAAEHAVTLAAYAEAEGFYRQALGLEPTPERHMALGEVLFVKGDFDGARDAYHRARAGFEAQGDQDGVARANLALADSFLPFRQGNQLLRWARQASDHDKQLDPETHARTHFILGAGYLLTGRPLAEAEDHLEQAAHLAMNNQLPQMAARSCFEIGNLMAERGDLPQALAAFEDTLHFSQAAGDHFQEVLAHNNLAYHALLAGDLARAHDHVASGLALAEEYTLLLPRQYLYSTRGEIALTEGELATADAWFEQALREAERFGNTVQAANIVANRARVAQAQGDLDTALALLRAAEEAVADMAAPYLRTQIDLWLAEYQLEHGDRAAAAEALDRAETRLSGTGRRGLETWAQEVRSRLTQPP